MTKTCLRAGFFALVLAPAIALAEESVRFAFELHGVFVGTVELQLLPDGRYEYRSTHLFTRGLGNAAKRTTRRRHASFRVDAAGRDVLSGAIPEALWLWRRPAAGCVDVIDDLGGARRRACVTRAGGEHVEGTIGPDSFAATYDTADRLTWLAIGPAAFTRVGAADAGAGPADLFGRGWPVERMRRASPIYTPVPVDEAELGTVPDFGGESCVDVVRAFTRWLGRRGVPVRHVHGLVAERGGDRAFPHLWARVLITGRWHDVDPTLRVAVTPETHVPLADVVPGDRSGVAGRAWLGFAAASTTPPGQP